MLYVCGFGHMRLEERIGAPGAGATAVVSSHQCGVGNQTQVLCMSSTCSLLLTMSPALTLDIFHSEDKSQTWLCDAYNSWNLGLVSPRDVLDMESIFSLPTMFSSLRPFLCTRSMFGAVSPSLCVILVVLGMPH